MPCYVVAITITYKLHKENVSPYYTPIYMYIVSLLVFNHHNLTG